MPWADWHTPIRTLLKGWEWLTFDKIGLCEEQWHGCWGRQPGVFSQHFLSPFLPWSTKCQQPPPNRSGLKPQFSSPLCFSSPSSLLQTYKQMLSPLTKASLLHPYILKPTFHTSLVVQGVKNPPANAGDVGLIPGLGRSHMPLSNWPVHHSYWPRALKLASYSYWSLCT